MPSYEKLSGQKMRDMRCTRKLWLAYDCGPHCALNTTWNGMLRIHRHLVLGKNTANMMQTIKNMRPYFREKN